MCVINTVGQIVGMITRKNLMTYYLQENHVVTRIQAHARRIYVQARLRDGYYQGQAAKNMIERENGVVQDPAKDTCTDSVEENEDICT